MLFSRLMGDCGCAPPPPPPPPPPQLTIRTAALRTRIATIILFMASSFPAGNTVSQQLFLPLTQKWPDCPKDQPSAARPSSPPQKTRRFPPPPRGRFGLSG